MKKILITGEGSYIGGSFSNWMKQWPEQYEINTVSTRNDEWKNKDFSVYDVIFDVAGIAHVKITSEMEPLFYKINRDMTIEICDKAKKEGISQFIFLSSMNVYGDTSEKIDASTLPVPKNFYGMSKLEADRAIQSMNSAEFKAVSIRPPVVYGLGCKGNFSKLKKFAGSIIPFFPDFSNIRSLIYIDHLCEFVRLMIDDQASGIFHPQNREYCSTYEMVKELKNVRNKKLIPLKILNPLIRLLYNRIHFLNRVFADDYYAKELSDYKNFSYCIYDFKQSILRS